MKASPLLITLAFVGIGVICLATGAIVSPSFVETHLSPDHVLEQATIARVQLAQGLLALLGILCLLVSLFAWLLGRFVFREGDRLRLLSLVVLRNLPLLTLVIIMCFVRVDNLMWMKTGGASNCYGLKTVFLSDEEKLGSWGWAGHHASVFYINDNTLEGSLVLVTERAAYFYRAKRPGIYWKDFRMEPFYEANSAEDAYEFLLSMGIDYLQISKRTMRQTLFQKSHFEEILSKPEMCRLIWDYRGGGPTQVFKLETPE